MENFKTFFLYKKSLIRTQLNALFTIALILLITPNFSAQSNDPLGDCGTTITPELYRAYQENVRNLDQSLIDQLRSSGFKVPVKFNIIRRTDGSSDHSPAITLATYEAAIDILNDTYDGTGVSFEMCSEPTYIDSDYYHDNLLTSPDFPGNLYDLAYNSSDANVYSIPNWFVPGSAAQPCPNCPEDEIDNILFLNFAWQLFGVNDDLSHEFGHHLGLLHTHGPTSIYHLPVESDQEDHPEDGLFPRELIIREFDPNAENFKFPNCGFAGDLCCDTPVTGRQDAANINSYPASGTQAPFAEQGVFYDLSACSYYGTYQDYNLDAMEDQPGLDIVSRNYMAYGASCRDNFTEDQIDRFMLNYDSRRANQYEISSCGNFADVVQFWDLPETMNEVSIQTTHNGTYKTSNAFTKSDGTFSGILYESTLTANVRKLGDNGLDGYTWDDWREELSTVDLIELSRHLVGLDVLNGYQILAGDANGNNQLETFDLIEIQKVILGINSEFTQHTGPWRFIPEYIPTNYPSDFHDLSPFDMIIDGVSTNGIAAYIEADWEYSISNGNNGQNGFHGYKVGDINGSSHEEGAPECDQLELAIANEQLLLSNSTYEIGFSIAQSSALKGFQLNLNLHPNASMDKLASILPNFLETDNSNVIAQNEGDEVRMVWHDAYGVSSSNLDNQFIMTISLNADTYFSELFITAGSGNLLVSDISDCINPSIINVALIAESTERDLKLTGIGNYTDLLVYPNPVGDMLYIQNLPKEAYGFIAIYNNLGQLVVNEKVMNAESPLKLDVSKLTSGIYYLKSMHNDFELFEKIYIE